MNIFGLTTVIPNENRREQTELRVRLGLEAFLNHVWRERDATLPPDHRSTEAIGVWPKCKTARAALPTLFEQRLAADVSPTVSKLKQVVR